MGSTWEHVAEAANVVQLTGLNAVALIGMIVKAASTARMQKRNCKQFAQHLKLIGNLLEQLKIPEMNEYPEMREPLEQLEDALRRAYVLVNSCQERSYLYLVAMGWNMVYQFRRAQGEIDRYLQIIPLITLLDNARVRERVEYIQKDQREYTFEDDDRRVQVAILSREPSRNDAMVLKKNLSCSYPDLPFDEALKKEKEKLKVELQQSQANMDVGQCEVIQRLIEVTENVASSPSVKTSSLRSSQTAKPKCSETNIEKGYSSNERDFKKNDSRATSRITSVSSGHDLLSTRGSHQHEEWHSDLLGCCSEPYLCFKTFFYPCGTFSKVASVATGKRMSSTDACNELMAYSLILSCCCYTCCIRRKLRKMLNITVQRKPRLALHRLNAWSPNQCAKDRGIAVLLFQK
ncbi:hypothetical protein HYC85_008757 [Camellia sinensis]|uniref:MCAfunc domain-containing protein n=1 Tax=Camellia sinensis TaxID=4442 RepID=A0A7J7HUH1_CAMSI|nr:hypothetical protein HYC85_008757 [Camellia sinensis]